MTNKNEVLGIDVVVNTDKAESTMNEFRDDTKWFKKRIESNLSYSLSLDVGKLESKLASARRALRQAIKEWNKDAEIKIRANIGILQQKTTQAKRELRNFARTGEKDVSVLGKLFDNTNKAIDRTQLSLMKIWRSGKELDTLRNRVKELKKAFDSGSISADKFAKENSKIQKELDKVNSSLSWWIGWKIKWLFGWFAGKIWPLAIGAGAIWVGKWALNLGDKLEQAQISFEVMLGSAEKAKTMLADLSDFAQKTPFELTGLRQTTKQLLAFGIDQEKMIPTLRSLGDVASGLSVPIEQIAYAYGQVRSANQLYGTELRQFMNAGVPLLAELANMFWVTEAEMKKMVENGKVGFSDVELAFQRMSWEGGRFENMMERQSSTFSGMWSNFMDQLDSFWEKVGTALLPSLKYLLEWLIKIFDFLVFVIWQTVEAITFISHRATEVFKMIWELLWITSQETEESIKNQVSFWEKLLTFLGFMWAAIVWVVQWVFETLQDIVTNFITHTENYFWNLWENLKGTLIATWQAIGNTLIWIVNKAIELIMTPINAAIDGLNQVITLASKIPGVDIGNIGHVKFKINTKFWDWKWIFEKIAEWWTWFFWGIWKKFWSSFSKNFNSTLIKLSENWIGLWKTQKVKNTTKNILSNMWLWWGGSSRWWWWWWWGGSGSSRAKKQANEARKAEEKRLKEAEKLEKKLAKTRTDSYKEAHKRAEKFADIIEETNKQLAEQRKKFEDLKKQALETIQDIDETLSNEKSSYQEKIAKRYKDIIKQVRDELWKESFFASSSDEGLVKALTWWQISWWIFNSLRDELKIIQDVMDSEALKLAVKKEERSETEKITEEYKKQVDLLERNKAVQQAKIDGRFLTNAETGETQFFDKEGKIIEWADREQQKDFKTQWKELQDIANEELKINKEKMDKIDSLYREFADERNRLNKNYFEEDKNMRINQENMIQAFFLNEIKRMAQQTQAAKQLTQALIALRSAGWSPWSVVTNNYNNSTNTVQNSRNNISVKTVADLKTIDKALGKRVSTRI